MMLKNTNMNALLEKSYECGSGAGMKHIGFYLDGLSLMVDGNKDGISNTQKASLKMMLNDNGKLEIAVNMEIGNE
jgi:hypothetical protein